MYGQKCLNHDDVAITLNKIERRKGKPIEVAALRDGDIVRNRTVVFLVLIDERDNISFFPAWSYLLGGMYVGSSGKRESITATGFMRLATKVDYPEPQYEPVVKTVVTPQTDGNFHCQNSLHGYMGQEFTVTAAELTEMKQRNDREWLY